MLSAPSSAEFVVLPSAQHERSSNSPAYLEGTPDVYTNTSTSRSSTCADIWKDGSCSRATVIKCSRSNWGRNCMRSCGTCEDARTPPPGSGLPSKDVLAGCRDVAIAIMTRRSDIEQRNVKCRHQTVGHALPSQTVACAHSAAFPSRAYAASFHAHACTSLWASLNRRFTALLNASMRTVACR